MSYTNATFVNFKGQDLDDEIRAYIDRHPGTSYSQAMAAVTRNPANRDKVERYNERSSGSTVVRNSQDGFEAAEVFKATLRTKSAPNRLSHKRINLRSASQNAANKVDRKHAMQLLWAMAEVEHRTHLISLDEAMARIVNLAENRALAEAAAVNIGHSRAA